MHKSTLVLTIIAVCILITRPCKSYAAQPATLNAAFNNLPGTAYRVVSNQSLVNDWAGEELAAGTTDNAGKLSSQLILGVETQVILFIGPSFYKLWLEPGSTLDILQTAKGLEFSGQNAKHNEFMFQAGIMQPFSITHGLDKKFEPVKVTAYFDSLETRRWNIYRSILKNDRLSQKFKDYCVGQISGYTMFQLSQYPMRFVYIEKSLNFSDIPSAYFSFWNKFKVLDTDPGSDMYYNAARDYISYLALKEYKFDASNQERLITAQLQIMDSLLATQPQTLATIKASQIDFLIKYFDFTNLTRTAMDKYAGQFPGTPETALLHKKWRAKNNSAFSTPTFTLLNNVGKPVSMLDFKGKIVYIDFWGSWCKACIIQIPASQQLQQQFAGQEIVFLYIDFYDSKEKWLNAINEYKISGLHLKAEKSDEQYFSDQFGINQGFPRYAVVDKEGKLITTAAPHPGDERTVSFLRDLLK